MATTFSASPVSHLCVSSMLSVCVQWGELQCGNLVVIHLVSLIILLPLCAVFKYLCHVSESFQINDEEAYLSCPVLTVLIRNSSSRHSRISCRFMTTVKGS